jgi:hypothetical protein
MLDLKGTVENRSMAGGVAVEQDSILSINLTKPASFANLKMTTCSRNYNTTTLKSDNKSEMPQEQR